MRPLHYWPSALRMLPWLPCLLTCASTTGCGDDVIRLGDTQLAETVGAVDSLLLRDAASQALLAELASATTLSIAQLPSPDVSLEAVVSGAVASVDFVVDGDSSVEVEVPFTYPGDIDGKLQSFRAVIGAHAATATPYSEVGAAGKRGASLQAAFVFVE